MAIEINGDTGISGVNGSATTPAIQGTDTNTGLSFGTDEVNIVTGGTTRATVDSSGRLLAGTSTAQGNNRLQLEGSASGASEWAGISLRRGVATASLVNNQYLGAISFQSQGGAEGGVIRAVCDANWSASSHPTRLTFETTASSSTSTTEQMRLTSTGDLRFNSGYGSVATAYGVRVWANINGTGTVAIRDSGNVSSITDHGTGQYTFTFTDSLPDANYSFVLTGNEGTPNNGSIVSAPSNSANATHSIRVDCVNNGGTRIDMEFLCLVIVR